MRLSFAFFLFLPSVFAVFDLRPEDLHLIPGGESCFQGAEKPTVCLMKLVREACHDSFKGGNLVDLKCLRMNVAKMCEKQYTSPGGNYTECVSRLNLASLAVTRDQCPTEGDVLTCYLHEAYYLCDGKFDCVLNSLDEICSDGCLKWKMAVFMMMKSKECDGGDLNCIAQAVNEGCGKDLQCAVPVVSKFCDLVNDNVKEARLCLSMVYARITERILGTVKPKGPVTPFAPRPHRRTRPTTRRTTTTTEEPWPQPPFNPVPSPTEEPPRFLGKEEPWPTEGPYVAPPPLGPEPLGPAQPWVPVGIVEPSGPILPVYPNVVPGETSTTVNDNGSNSNSTVSEETSTENPWQSIQQWHVIVIACGLSAAALIALGLLGFLYWKVKKDQKIREEAAAKEQAAAAAAAKKKAEESSKKERESRKEMSKNEMSKRETSKTETSAKEASKSEASKKETSQREEKTEKSTGSKE